MCNLIIYAKKINIKCQECQQLTVGSVFPCPWDTLLLCRYRLLSVNRPLTSILLSLGIRDRLRKNLSYGMLTGGTSTSLRVKQEEMCSVTTFLYGRQSKPQLP